MRAFCLGWGGSLTRSSSTLPSLLLSVASVEGGREGGREAQSLIIHISFHFHLAALSLETTVYLSNFRQTNSQKN